MCSGTRGVYPLKSLLVAVLVFRAKAVMLSILAS